MPGPSQISCPFFPTGFFGAGFFWPPWHAYIIITFVVTMFIIKVGYGVSNILQDLLAFFVSCFSINFW